MTFTGKLSFLAAACLLANTSATATTQTQGYLGTKRKNNLNVLPFLPRLTVDGATGGHANSFVYADSMIPVVGNQDSIFFLDGTGKGGTDKGWLAALGGGFRQIWRGAIFGGYVFGERDRTYLADTFWTVNPGVEVMSSHWDMHVNGYIPAGSRENVLNTLFADQIGLTNFPIVFRGRQQFGEAFNLSNQVAPGMDAELGYIIPNTKRIRAFGGGYHFWFNHSSQIQGLEGGVEIPLNQTFSLFFRDTYDNLKRNTAVFSLRLNLGGITKFDENDIHERMLDIIPRHLSVIYTGSGIPTQQSFYDTGELQLERENIWFFRPDPRSTIAAAVGPFSCTYENPCDTEQLTQGNINAIKGISPPGSNLYLAPGDYLIGAITLNPGQSIFGRTADFTRVANATNADLYGSITLMGNNILQGFDLFNQLTPNGPNAGFPVGIVVAGGEVGIENVTVGPTMIMEPFAPIPNGTFSTGITVTNSFGVFIADSTINAADIEDSTVTYFSLKTISISSEMQL